MFVAVHGELCEGMLHRGKDHAGQEGAQEVVPAGGECVWFRGAVEEHRQLEALPHRRVIRTGGGESKVVCRCSVTSRQGRSPDLGYVDFRMTKH
jgi:hypothetical protein